MVVSFCCILCSLFAFHATISLMDVIKEFLKLKNKDEALHLMKFFKTGKGEYAENDKFLGIRVPKTRELVKKFYGKVNLQELIVLLENEYHEIRLFALLMLVKMFDKNPEMREEIVEIYLSRTKFINNWDLVDLTAHKIIGKYCFETNNNQPIINLSNTKHLWSERIGVVSQWHSIKNGEFNLTLELCEKFLAHKHNLMHKACGWMLREVGKKDEKTLLNFLDKFHKQMPRTMLRYSLEKLDVKLKKHYMG